MRQVRPLFHEALWSTHERSFTIAVASDHSLKSRRYHLWLRNVLVLVLLVSWCALGHSQQANRGVGCLTSIPAVRTRPVSVGDCRIIRNRYGFIVSLRRNDSLFLVTAGKNATPLYENTGTARIEAIADYALTSENKFYPDFYPYGLYCTNANVLWLFGWRSIDGNNFDCQVVSISNEGTSGTVELGSMHFDSVSLNENGELEMIEYPNEFNASRTTIRDGRAESMHDTTIKRLHQYGWRALDSSMQRMTVMRQLQPNKSGFFKAPRECRAAIDVSTCTSHGITWLLTSDGVFGVRNDVLQHLHSYEYLVPMSITVQYDTSHSHIRATLPWTERFSEVTVKLIDYEGKTVAEKKIRARSTGHVSFSTKKLKAGTYSVIASSVSKRGVRTVRVP